MRSAFGNSSDWPMKNDWHRGDEQREAHAPQMSRQAAWSLQRTGAQHAVVAGAAHPRPARWRSEQEVQREGKAGMPFTVLPLTAAVTRQRQRHERHSESHQHQARHSTSREPAAAAGGRTVNSEVTTRYAAVTPAATFTTTHGPVPERQDHTKEGHREHRVDEQPPRFAVYGVALRGVQRGVTKPQHQRAREDVYDLIMSGAAS